jgi:transposase
MAYLIKKSVKGKFYYYLAESKRIDGKPKVIWQKYLGTADALKHIVEQQPLLEPQHLDCKSFGLEAALLHIAESINLVSVINDLVETPQTHPISLGDYILLIILNRCCQPCSKNRLKRWYNRSFLSHKFPFPPDRLTSQEFWTQMGYLHAPDLDAIQETLCTELAKTFDLSPECLFYDATNYFTFIEDHKNNTLPQRGHNKAKRFDLRQINVALLVTKDFNIPLFHSTDSGHINDVTRFKTEIHTLMARLQTFCETCKSITLVFDKGNNSQPAFQAFQDSDYHFVGSLRPSSFKKFFQIPLKQFQPLKPDSVSKPFRVYRFKHPVYGTERTLVLTFHTRRYKKQILTLRKTIRKRLERLEEFKSKLNTGKWIHKQTVIKKVKQLLGNKQMRKLISFSVKQKRRRLYLEYSVNKETFAQEKKVLGKSLLFTDQHAWSNQEILDAYYGKNGVEEAFKTIKSPHTIAIMPMWHWTDQKIKVHVFCCILALLVLSLLRKYLHNRAIDLPLSQIIEQLKDLKQITLFYPNGQIRHQLSQMNPVQRSIYDALNLERYFSVR